MLVENFLKFVKYYGKERKIKLFGFLALSLIVGLLEFIGIALIYPFILLIVKPESVINTQYYKDFANFLHINNVLLNAFILGLIVTLLFIAKNLFMIFNLYLQNKFISNWKLFISQKFMHYYLFSPYKNLISTSPSEKIYNITFLVNQTLDGFIFRIISLVTNLAIVLMILFLLLIKFPLAAVLTGTFILFSINFNNTFFKKKLYDISKKFLKTSSVCNEKIQESINNIKEIKILSAENFFYNQYLTSQKDYNKILLQNNFYGSIPPYIIEILVVLSLVILAGIISLQNINNTSWMIASYAVVAAAIFRIAPSLNRIQTAINNINSSRELVKIIIGEAEKLDLDIIEEKTDAKAEFNDCIKLKNITFSYKKDSVIKNLNLEIKKGEFIGIIGLSGAGKSTLADIIMGLLPIDGGEILVDDIEFNQKNFSALRKLIGYVPQQVNILDGSFKRNVAWGTEEEKIDKEKVINSLKMAKLDDLAYKYDEGINAKAIVGAAGLSQGQKQRLAIARALYRDPEILIFDEATSSLDVTTEDEITRMLNALKGEKTIIAIAHRLSTLKSCSRLVYLKNGEIAGTGTFEELSDKHPDFEKLIKLSNLNK